MVAELDLSEVHYLRPVLRIPFSEEIWQEAEAHVMTVSATSDLQQRPSPDIEAAGPSPEQVRGALRDAWRATLGLEHPTDEDNFFANGGTSLTVIRLVHLISQSLPGTGFDVADIYGAPTFGGQFALLSEPPAADQEPVDADLDTDPVATVFAQLERGEISPDDAAELLSRAELMTGSDT